MFVDGVAYPAATYTQAGLVSIVVDTTLLLKGLHAICVESTVPEYFLRRPPAVFSVDQTIQSNPIVDQKLSDL